MGRIQDQLAWNSTSEYLPVMHHDKSESFHSDLVMVKLVRGSSQGEIGGFSTAKIIFDIESHKMHWDMSAFEAYYQSPRQVVEWRQIPSDYFYKFNSSLKGQ